MTHPTDHWGTQLEICMLRMMFFKKTDGLKPVKSKTAVEFSIPIHLIIYTQGLHHAT